MKLKLIVLIFIPFYLHFISSDLLSINKEFHLKPEYVKVFNLFRNQMKKYESNFRNKLIDLNSRGAIKFQQIYTLTAREKLDSAIQYAKNYSTDAELKAVLLSEYYDNSPSSDSIDGKAFTVSYYFNSNQKGIFAIHYSFFDLVFDTTLTNFPFSGGKITINDYFIDSDTISFIAETNGGYDFRSEQGTVTSVFYELRSLTLEDILAPDTVNIYWKLTYLKSDSAYNLKEFLIFYINPSNGNIVNKLRGKFTPVTIKQHFSVVDSVAKSAYPDAKLMYALGFEDDIFDGKSLLITYGYLAQDTLKFSVNLLFGFPVLDDTSGWVINDIEFNKQINMGSYLDSDTLVSIGEINGGKAFRETYQLISGGFLYSQSIFDTSQIHFHSIYNAVDSVTGYAKNLIQIIDPVTGSFINSIYLKTENDFELIPHNYILYQNYPNPFNSITKIKYYVPISSYVSIKLYDLSGREVDNLTSGYHKQGEYEVIFDTDKLTSGIYFYVLRSDKVTISRKMVLIK